MTLQRHSTAWYESLDEFVGKRAAAPFVWGVHDCCTFAADWVLLARGVDHMGGVRGLETAAAAVRELEARGGLRAAVGQQLGEELPGPMAQAGDVVMVRHDGRSSLGICVGSAVAAPAAAGLAFVPLDMAEVAWRV